LDVDLEDKLLYGLTPMRLAYLVVGLLGGFTIWTAHWAPAFVRAPLCVAVVAVGAAAAWGRWRGRGADSWVSDIALFLVNTNRVAWEGRSVRRFKLRPNRPRATHTPTGAIEIVVAGRTPRAGASTVAAELAACLSANQWLVNDAPTPDELKPNAARVLLSVAAVDGMRVCYLDRGEGPYFVGFVPDDDSVRQAAALNEATVVAFPDALASQAFRTLAEAITGAG
jgi:hypothetical protein